MLTDKLSITKLGVSSPVLEGMVKSAVNNAGWAEYDQIKDQVFIQTKVLFFTVKITGTQLRPLFVRLFGERPADFTVSEPSLPVA
jgi:hypothetical protein